MNMGQQFFDEPSADSISGPGVMLRKDGEPEAARPRMTAADAVYMTATVTAGVLLLISVLDFNSLKRMGAGFRRSWRV